MDDASLGSLLQCVFYSGHFKIFSIERDQQSISKTSSFIVLYWVVLKIFGRCVRILLKWSKSIFKWLHGISNYLMEVRPLIIKVMAL